MLWEHPKNAVMAKILHYNNQRHNLKKSEPFWNSLLKLFYVIVLAKKDLGRTESVRENLCYYHNSLLWLTFDMSHSVLANLNKHNSHHDFFFKSFQTKDWFFHKLAHYWKFKIRPSTASPSSYYHYSFLKLQSNFKYNLPCFTLVLQMLRSRSHLCLLWTKDDICIQTPMNVPTGISKNVYQPIQWGWDTQFEKSHEVPK